MRPPRPPRIEGGPGEGRASTRAASGARRAPAVVDDQRVRQCVDNLKSGQALLDE